MNEKTPAPTGGREQISEDNLIAAKRYRWRHYGDFSRPLDSVDLTGKLLRLTSEQTWSSADYERAAALVEHQDPIGCLRMARWARRSR